jgi:acetyl-CoA decarbonylase/synthase, CODH/ACS complex subunit gamma
MALSGLDIFKLLPKTNCGECGVPTCMAFAMKLAQKKAELKDCPHASDAAKAALGAASEPPIRLVRIGGQNPVALGNETVMFRHEKTFFHQPGIAVRLKTSAGTESLLATIKDIEGYSVERVGETLRPDLFFISHDSGRADDLLAAVGLVKAHSTRAMILDCPDVSILPAAMDLAGADHPAVLLRGEVTDRDLELAKARSLSLVLTASTFDGLEKQAVKARGAGVNDLFLNLSKGDVWESVQNNTILRRSALKKSFKPFGYPLFVELGEGALRDVIADAALLLCKYASVLVLPGTDKALLYSLLTLRQNIYTDPQKPIQVEPKLYPLGEPTPASPVFVTTNFSLTFYIVSGEIENSGISAHLVVMDTEGQSVLTAWAAGKFGGEKIAKFIKEIRLEEHVTTRKIVIPGLAAQMSGDLEEHLPGWRVVVGCQDAADIPSFVKNVDLT